MKYSIVTIERKLKLADHSPIVVIGLSNGNTIIRDELQFSYDAARSNMTEDEIIRDCGNGGSLEGEVTFNKAGTTYVIDENSSRYKHGVINPATGKAFEIGDEAIREKDGFRVEGFLSFAKNAEAAMDDRIADRMAARMLQMRAQRFAPKAAAETETQKTESAETFTAHVEETFEGDDDVVITAEPEGDDDVATTDEPATQQELAQEIDAVVSKSTKGSK